MRAWSQRQERKIHDPTEDEFGDWNFTDEDNDDAQESPKPISNSAVAAEVETQNMACSMTGAGSSTDALPVAPQQQVSPHPMPDVKVASNLMLANWMVGKNCVPRELDEALHACSFTLSYRAVLSLHCAVLALFFMKSSSGNQSPRSLGAVRFPPRKLGKETAVRMARTPWPLVSLCRKMQL